MTTPIAQGQVAVNVRELSYSYDLLFDIKTPEQLQHEVEYLAHRLGGIVRLCRDDGYSIDEYVLTVMEFPNATLSSAAATSERERIAKQWDGCMYGTIGGEDDIGACIRRDIGSNAE